MQFKYSRSCDSFTCGCFQQVLTERFARAKARECGGSWGHGIRADASPAACSSVQSIASNRWREQTTSRFLPPSHVSWPLGSQQTQPCLPLLQWAQDGPSQRLKATQTLTRQLPWWELTPWCFLVLELSLCLSPRDLPKVGKAPFLRTSMLEA